MRLRRRAYLTALMLVFLGTMAWADQLVLKDGTAYSGKFIRGDSNTVDFRILGRTEIFKISDIAQIVFKEPELDTSASVRTSTRVPAQPAAPSGLEPNSGEETQTQAPQKATVELRRPSQAANQGLPAQSDTAPRATGSGNEIGQAAPASAGSVTFPVGTPVTIRTSTGIDTDRNRVGDIFDASLEQPMVFGEQTIFPLGTTVKGRIAYAKESGKLSGQSQLILELTELMANGKSYLLRTSDYTEVGANRANRTAATVGGTAALGAIIGAIAGGGTGAAIGAASGAAVGTGVQVMTRGQVLKIPAETILEFRLQSPLNVDIP
jgi:hypothetical protein